MLKIEELKEEQLLANEVESTLPVAELSKDEEDFLTEEKRREEAEDADDSEEGRDDISYENEVSA